MRELLMIRHGVTEANERRVFTGATDIPLSEAGILALKEREGMYPAAGIFFTSGMLRARQTLEILYGPVPHTDIPSLAEYCFGDFEGRSHDELIQTEPAYRLWLETNGEEAACPGGETRAAFAERVRAGWKQLTGTAWDGRAVLVTHGGVIAAVMGQITGAGGGAHRSPGNGDGWRMRLDGDAVVSYEAFP